MVFLKANEERFFFEVENSIEEFHLAHLTGAEEISSLYHFEIEVVSDDADIDISALVGKSAVVTIMDQGGLENEYIDEQCRFIHGLIAEIKLGAQGVSQSTYHIVLVPKVWILQHRKNSRIFQQQDIKSIISKVLVDGGIENGEFRFELSKTYPEYDYCVQYRETDLGFIQRLLVEEGVHYYFEHTDEKHVLVFSDTSRVNPVIIGEAEINCYHDGQGAIREQHIFSFSYSESIVSGKVTLRDFDFRKPNLKLEAFEKSTLDTALEVYDHPGRFYSSERGRNNATIRLESLNSYRKSAQGSSDVNRLTPGYSYTLRGHDRDDLNVEYLIARVEHFCSQPQVLEAGATTEGSKYSNKFICVPLDVSFRPSTDIHYPVVEGSQTATVTGPEGEEIYTDEHGRIKVQFHWDREGKSDQDSSCWIRVSQPSAGGAFGGMFIPRIGEEVVVDFLEGDPDQPLIIGRVYHGLNRPPYKLPENKTISTLKSNSSKGGGGFNELRFEDKKGEEQLFIHSEKDTDIRTKNIRREWVGNNRHLIVENDRYAEIRNNDHTTVIADQHIKVEGDSHFTFVGDHFQKTESSENYVVAADRISEIGANDNLKVSSNINHETGSKYSIKAGNQIHINAGTSIHLEAGGSKIHIGPGGISISGPAINLNSGGAPGASPVKPAKVSQAVLPNKPLEALNSVVGRVTTTVNKSSIQQPKDFSPQAKAMIYAAKAGTPFCQQCEDAKKS
ncbi:type VI secretion system Vgr family protein [Amphritea sp.]|uniref:type VI secretion system Vgr family protein n=1 Tax=Amphritea sp. TaxID=1872502 RepID=UPI003D133A1E